MSQHALENANRSFDLAVSFLSAVSSAVARSVVSRVGAPTPAWHALEMRFDRSIRATIVVAASVLGASCSSGVSCPETFRWGDDLPDTLSAADVRTLRLTACRNDECAEGDLAVLPLDEPTPGSAHGVPLDGESSAFALYSRNEASVRRLEVIWTDRDARDGDRYRVEVRQHGALVAGLAEQTVTYATWHPNGPLSSECRQVILEGSTAASPP